MVNKAISLIGVPTDIGAGHRGASMGPEALRVANLGPRLAKRGLDVVDRGNLQGPLSAQSGLGRATPHATPVSPVPEPSEWALMAAGLALVGYIVRRSSKRD